MYSFALFPITSSILNATWAGMRPVTIKNLDLNSKFTIERNPDKTYSKKCFVNMNKNAHQDKSNNSM